MHSKFLISFFSLAAGGFSLMLTTVSADAADQYPSKPIRIIVPAATGGGLDLTTRLIAIKMSEKLGQPVVVDNRAGDGTMIGTRIAKDAPADGYTILAQAPSFSLAPYIRLNPGFDPIKDFTGLGNMLTLPVVMLVGAQQPDKSVMELVARAKRGKLNFATGGPGTPQEIAAAQFLQAAGITDATEIKYKGTGPAQPDIAAGRVDFGFDAYISTKSYIDGALMRPLAVTSANRLVPLPNVPTFMELGYNFTHNMWLGLVVRTGTPKVAIQRLSEALKYAQESKELSDRFRAEGSDPSYTSPEAWTDYLRKEYVDMGRLAAELKYEKQ